MRNLLVVNLTIFAAVLLMLLPMPAWTVWMRPAWVLMVLLFWCIVRPDILNVGIAWTVGLMVDFLTGTALGEHALAYTVVIYIASGLHHRLIMFPLLQQTVCVLLFSLIYQSVIYGVQTIIGEPPATQLFWCASLTTMLLWPWLFVMLHNCKRHFKV